MSLPTPLLPFPKNVLSLSLSLSSSHFDISHVRPVSHSERSLINSAIARTAAKPLNGIPPNSPFPLRTNIVIARGIISARCSGLFSGGEEKSSHRRREIRRGGGGGAVIHKIMVEMTRDTTSEETNLSVPISICQKWFPSAIWHPSSDLPFFRGWLGWGDQPV